MAKTTFHANGNYPNTYMEQFCKALHPDLEMGKVCVTWFRQAINHCTNLLRGDKVQTTYFWATVKKFIFPDRTTEIMSQRVPISIHPKRLTLPDCQSLFLDIVSDYVQRAPRYAAESAANSILWQVLYSLFGILTMVALFLGTIYAYYNYGKTRKTINILEDVFQPHKCMKAAAARSLRLTKTELRNIKIKKVTREEEIIAMDERDTLILKMATKYEFLESIVLGSIDSIGKFYRLYNHQENSKTEFKIETINKALKFMNNCDQKIHLIIMFEDDKNLDGEEAARKRNKKNLSPNAKQSPRQILNNRLEGGGAGKKQSEKINSIGNTSRPSTPKLQNVPRSNNTPRSSSGIPRNVQKTPSSARKSK